MLGFASETTAAPYELPTTLPTGCTVGGTTVATATATCGDFTYPEAP
jgi:hypothetical protein